jgi:hypothetical protein
MIGAGWWSDAWDTVKSVAKKVAKPAITAGATMLGGPAAGALAAGLATAVGLARPMPHSRSAAAHGAGRFKKAYSADGEPLDYVPRKPKRQVSAAVMERNGIVARVKREMGLTLPEASRYVKEQGLWQARR